MIRSTLSATKRTPLAPRGMVVAEHPLGAEVGAGILKRGGNAVDAAVATAFAMPVVEPFMSSLAGGGTMLVHLARRGETLCVGRAFFGRRGDDAQRSVPLASGALSRFVGHHATRVQHAETQRALSAREREIHLGEQLGVQQCAMQRAMRVVDLITLAQGVQAVPLSGMHLAGERQGVDDLAIVRQPAPRRPEPREFMIDEADVESGIVDDEFGAPHEFDEIGRDVGEAGAFA